MPASSLRKRKLTNQRGAARPTCRPRLENLEDRLVLFTGITNSANPAVQYATINAAIAAANPGDTIDIGPGVYKEDVVVNKSLTFLGQNFGVNPNTGSRSSEAILEPATTDINNGNIVTVEVSNVTFDGFTFEGSNGTTGSGTVTIGGVVINAAFGISDLNANSNNNFSVNHIVVQNNILTDLNLGGVVMDTFGATGASTNNVIASNKISNVAGYDPAIQVFGTGIIAADNFYASITGNVISGVQDGIQVDTFAFADGAPGSVDQVANNTVSYQATGFFYNHISTGSSPFTFSGNTLTAGTPNGFVPQTGAEIFNVSGTGTGVFTNNSVTGGQIAVEFWNDATSTKMTWTGGTLTAGSTSGFIGFQVPNSDPTFGRATGPTSVILNQATVVLAASSSEGVAAVDSGGVGPQSVSVTVQGSLITGGPIGVLVSGTNAMGTVLTSTIESETTAGIDIVGGTFGGVTNSLVKNNGTNILIGAGSTISGQTFDNDLTPTSTGKSVSSLFQAFDASGNYWGTNVPATILSKTSGSIDITPFIDQGTNSAPPGTNAFQGSTNVLDVTASGPQLAAIGRIQEGVNFLPSSGGTINILAGIFLDNVKINKAATLIGAAALSGSTTVETAVNGPNPGSGVLPVGAATIFLIQSSNVKIENLTVEGSTPNLPGAITEGGVPINTRNGIADDTVGFPSSKFNNTTISGVVVKDVFLRGINLGSGGTGLTITNNQLSNIIGGTTGSDISAAIAIIGGSATIGGTAASTKNTITNATTGIFDSQSLGTVIVDNVISGVNVGIHTDNLAGAVLPEVIQGNSINNPTAIAGTFTTGIYALAPAAQVYVYANSVGTNSATGFDIGLAQYGSVGATLPVVIFNGNTLTDTTEAFNTSILITTAGVAGGTSVAGSVNASIQGNIITNATSLTSHAFKIATGNSATTSITINAISNQISNSTVGILQSAGVSGTNLHFNANSFLGTTFGYQDVGVTGTTTDATYNYWGIQTAQPSQATRI